MGLSSVEVTGSTFTKNYSYLQASSIQLYEVDSIAIDKSDFTSNSGGQMSKGGAIAIYEAELVEVTDSTFFKN
jgi:hypothetical protein